VKLCTPLFTVSSIISISFGGHPIAPDANDLDTLADVQPINKTQSAEIINIFILIIEPPMSFMSLKPSGCEMSRPLSLAQEMQFIAAPVTKKGRSRRRRGGVNIV
jgi:hypothetical protein